MMEEQNQTAVVTPPTKNEMLQKDLEDACKLLGRYLLSNDTLAAFMGPLHNNITLTTEIIDTPDDEEATSKKVLTVKLTSYNSDDKPVVNMVRFPLVNYQKSDKYSYLLQ